VSEDARPSSFVWRRGLSWLESQSSHFALPRGPLDPDALFPLKVLSELGRVVEVLARSRALPADDAERVASLLRFAWRELDSGRVFAERLALRPYPVLGSMYATFERQGFSHPETRTLLARLGSSAGVRSTDFPRRPFETVEPSAFGADAPAVLGLGLALAWRQMNLTGPWSVERLLPRTRLGQLPEVAALSDAEAYSLTHVVFFVTDFGERPEALPEACRAYLRARVPAWLDAQRRAANLDLYAELAATLACAGDALPGEVEEVLHAAQAADGSLPGPVARSSQRRTGVVGDAVDAERRFFLANYHTTLAGILASFAATVGLVRRPD